MERALNSVFSGWLDAADAEKRAVVDWDSMPGEADPEQCPLF